MATVDIRYPLALVLGGSVLVACSSNDSTPSQSLDEAQPGIGGLPNYGYAGNASYGGYAAFAGQPWGGANGTSTGGTSGPIGATGGKSTVSSGGTTPLATSTSATGGSNTGGRSSMGGASNTGGRATGGALGTGGQVSLAGTSSTGGSRASAGGISTGGKSSTGGAPATGGKSSTGGAPATGGAAGFNWGTVTYSPTGGSAVNHQGHNTGAACLASCHTHTFQSGGTIYQTNGTTTAGNVQVGIIMNGTLYTAYSGTLGNFFIPLAGTLDWTTAQIAIRTASGTAIHPTTSGLSGNCNSCHGSSNRIVVP